MQDDIIKAAEVLQSGGVILYPTDTIWGIGCDATNAEAVERIYEIKQRVDTKAMLVLLDSESRLMQYIAEVPEVAWELLDVADKPLTIIYPGAKNLAANLIAHDGSIGIRITKDEFCRKLISRFKKPIVSTSANISGMPAASNYREITEGIKQLADFIVSWKQEETARSKPSSIIRLGLGGQVEILRK